MPHQVEAVKFCLDRRGTLLHLHMGSGKTLIGLELSRHHKRTLVVCPRSLVFNWEREANLCFPDLETGVFLSEMKGNSPTKKQREQYKELKRKQVVFCGYEATLKLSDSQIQNFDLVILDECQRVKSGKVKFVKNLYRNLSKSDPRIVLMSGTPAPNSVDEYHNLFRMIENEEFSIPKEIRSVTKFREMFMYLEGEHTVFAKNRILKIPKYRGFRNKERFRELFSPVIFHKEIDLELGTLTHQDLRVSAKIPKRTLEALEKAFFEEGKDLEQFQTARRFSAIAKAPACAEYIVDYNNPAVVFSCYPEALKRVQERLENEGKTSVMMTASDSPKERMQKVTEFQEGKVDYILGTIGVMNSGYTLTRASLVVLIDLDPVPGNNHQAICRIHRKGQTKNCRAVFLSHSGIDSRIIKITTSKKEDLEKVKNYGY